MGFVYWLIHWTGSDYGAPYGHFVLYDFLSGFAGLGIIGAIAELRRVSKRHHAERLAQTAMHHREIRDITKAHAASSAAAHQITADLHAELTGRKHALHPDPEKTVR